MQARTVAFALALLLGPACGDGDGGGADTEQVRVVAGPISEGADRLVIAMGGLGLVEESLGAWPVIDSESGTASQVFEGVPEGPKRVFAASFGTLALSGDGFPSNLHRCFDYAVGEVAQVGAQDGVISLVLSDTWPGDATPVGSAQVGFDRVALDGAYVFAADEPLAGAFDAANISIVAIDGGTAGGTVTVEAVASGDAPVGLFAELPDALLDGWPATEAWSDRLSLTLDGAGDATAYVVAKPGAVGRSVRVNVVGADAGVPSSACLLRLVSSALLTANAQ